MPNDNKIKEFLQKLAPCIERGELDGCVEEAARLVDELGIEAGKLLDLSSEEGISGRHDYAYVFALVAGQRLEGKEKAIAYYNAGLAAQSLRKFKTSEKHYLLAIEYDPKLAAAHSNYANLLKELKRNEDAEKHYLLAIEANPKYAAAHYNYAILLKELKRSKDAEKHYLLAIEANPKYAAAHSNYANLLKELRRNEDAEKHYLLAIEYDPKLAAAHSNYANLLKELKRNEDAEKHYLLAIEANPKLAEAHSNYANLLLELKRNEDAEKHYLLAIEANPKYAEAHSNYANLLSELKRNEDAEKHYLLAIEANPKYAAAHYNYAILLKELKRNEDAEKHYLLAIEAKSKYATAHYNYANLLSELKRNEDAKKHYLLAIEANPKYAAAHYNYAILLSKLKRNEDAEKHYLLAIEANPKHAKAHGAFGLLLIEMDRREKGLDETKNASNLFKESGRITESHLALAWFHERYSEKYFNMRQFPESGEDAGKAGDEYLKAAETENGALKDNFSQHGNILKAKSFVRKVPKKYWHTKILYRFGRKRDIPGIINNLKQAASYYEKAAMCPIKERQSECNACHTSISVFSDTLSVMEAFINKRSPEINKKEWMTKLDGARLIYEEKKMKNGVALVDTLKQLIKCVDELAVHREGGLGIQKEKCGKCYNRLTEVSENLDGALNVLAEHGIEAIREYAKKQGMVFEKKENPNISVWDKQSIKALLAILTIIAAIIGILQLTKHDTEAFDYIKSFFSNGSAP